MYLAISPMRLVVQAPSKWRNQQGEDPQEESDRHHRYKQQDCEPVSLHQHLSLEDLPAWRKVCDRMVFPVGVWRTIAAVQLTSGASLPTKDCSRLPRATTVSVRHRSTFCPTCWLAMILSWPVPTQKNSSYTAVLLTFCEIFACYFRAKLHPLQSLHCYAGNMNGNEDAFPMRFDCPEAPKNWSRGELIGAGAFGRVYLGLNNDNGELVAVKQARTNFGPGHCCRLPHMDVGG